MIKKQGVKIAPTIPASAAGTVEDFSRILLANPFQCEVEVRDCPKHFLSIIVGIAKLTRPS
jgi:hypothetical protein